MGVERERPSPRWRAADLRSVPAALGAALAAFLGVGVPAWCGPGASALGMLALGSLAVAARTATPRRRSAASGIAVSLALAALMLGLLAAEHERRGQAEVIALDGRSVSAELTITSSCRGSLRGVSCSADARVQGADGAVVDPLPVRLYFALAGEEGPPRFGEQLRVTGSTRLLPSEEAAVFSLTARTVEERVMPAGPVAWAAELRDGFRDRAGVLGGLGAELLPGLAIGDTALVSAELDAWMKQSSLTHLTAVSGANCAIVVAGMTGLMSLLGARRGVRIAVSLAALGLFVLLVTPEPSVLRAAVMAVIVLFALASGRAGGGVPALSAAVILLLLVDPWLVRSYGFVLSVAATAGLLLLAGPLTRQLSRFLPAALAAALALPLAAQLACQPVLILLEPSIPVYGVIANLLAAPAAPMATVLGLLACLLLPIAAPVGELLLHLAWWPAAWIGSTAELAAGLPGARLDWLPDGWGVLALAGLTVLGLVALFALRPRGRRAAGILLVTSLAATAALGLGLRWAGDWSRPAGWSFAACDVGQGDAALLQDSGRVALIDTGEDPQDVLRCLELLGVQRIDLLVITHWDVDHAGGAAALLGRVDVLLHGPLASPADALLLQGFAASGTQVVEGRRGAGGSLGGLRWTVLWPKPPPHRPAPGNDASLVIEVRPSIAGRGLSALLLGDLGEEAQLGLLAAQRSAGGTLSPVDVVKVAHHGSADQSPQLYRAAPAAVAIFSAGEGNSYGHPREEPMALVEELGSAVRRTDRDGLILIGRDEDGALWAWTER